MFRASHRRCACTVAALIFPLVAKTADAQIRFKRAAADCNLARRAFDNPFHDSRGWYMRRYQWHVSYQLASLGVGYALHRTTSLPAWASAGIPSVGIGLLPHVRQTLIANQPINPADWAFDLVNRSTPAMWAVAHKKDHEGNGIQWKRHAITLGVFAVAYAALSCYSSP